MLELNLNVIDNKYKSKFANSIAELKIQNLNMNTVLIIVFPCALMQGKKELRKCQARLFNKRIKMFHIFYSKSTFSFFFFLIKNI